MHGAGALALDAGALILSSPRCLCWAMARPSRPPPGSPRTVSRFDYRALTSAWLTEPVVTGIPPTRHIVNKHEDKCKHSAFQSPATGLSARGSPHQVGVCMSASCFRHPGRTASSQTRRSPMLIHHVASGGGGTCPSIHRQGISSATSTRFGTSLDHFPHPLHFPESLLHSWQGSTHRTPRPGHHVQPCWISNLHGA